MSFSSTLYRISQTLFSKMEAGLIKAQELINESKDFVTIQDSSDAVKYILKKRAVNGMHALIDEIFSPRQNIGSVSDEEFQKLVDSFNYEEIDRITSSTFYFLPLEKITALSSFLDSFDPIMIKKLYDAGELNSKGIYPELWSSSEDVDKAYSLSHIQSDIDSLKTLFKDASIEKDYILTFSG